jgi:hypothetical protein
MTSDNYFEYNTEYDSDSEDNYSDVVYEPEEPSETRFCIALCDLYNVNIHGPGNINGHYLVNCRYKMLHMDWISETADFIHTEYQVLQSYYHDLHPNYRNIVLRENYIKPEIVECIDIEGCFIAIIKTFWIKIIQRAWRRVLKKREEAINRRQTLYAIRYKEINGKWPLYCYAEGGIQGLLRLKR